MNRDHLSWFSSPEGQFGDPGPDPEYPHKAAAKTDPASTETYWFAFNDETANLVGHFYIKARQTIGGCGAGSWMYRGFNPLHPMAVAHYDWHTLVPTPDMVEHKLHIPLVGLTFELVDPLKCWRIAYASFDGNADAQLEVNALMPPAVTPRGTHFDQAVWFRGRVRIGDENITIDCPGTRDRTWNEPRPELSLALPPTAYVWGVSGDGKTAFCLRGSDDPDSGVHWAQDYGLTRQQAFHGGWIYIDGQLRMVTEMSKRVRRDMNDKMRPLAFEIDFTDATGEKHHLAGPVMADMWSMPWGNVFTWFSTFKWTLNQKINGRAESQDGVWTQYVRKYWRAAATGKHA